MATTHSNRSLSLARRHGVLLALQLVLASGLLAAAGCSTAPFADMLDFLVPGGFPSNAKATAGGVDKPQGGPAGGVLIGPPPGPTPFPPAAGLPPLPVSGSAGLSNAPTLPPTAPVSQTQVKLEPW